MYVDRLSTGIAAQSQPAKQPPDKVGLLEADAAREANLLLGGSDGETSDYQRSTPSPRDSETSEDKCLDPVCWKDGLPESPASLPGLHHQGPASLPGLHHPAAAAVNHRDALSSSISPDLGFVDFIIDPTVTNSSHTTTNKSFINIDTNSSSSSRRKNNFVPSSGPCSTSTKRLAQPQLSVGYLNYASKDSKISSLPPQQRLSSGSNSSSNKFSQLSQVANMPPQSQSQIMLNKKLSVQLQKLPKMLPLVVMNNSPLATQPPKSIATNAGRHKLPVGQLPRPQHNKSRFEIPRAKEISIPQGKNSSSLPNTVYRDNNAIKCRKSKLNTATLVSNQNFLPTKIFYSKNPPTSSTLVASDTKNLVQAAANKISELSSRRKSISENISHSSDSLNNEELLSDDKLIICDESISADSLADITSDSLADIKVKSIHSDILSTTSSEKSSSVNNEDSGISSLAESSSSGSNGSTAEAVQRPFRFPTLSKDRSAIPCKWEDCGSGFKSHARLSDHIKTVHMLPQLVGDDSQKKDFCCFWQGCKVYGAKSSSASWLQKHVPLHGGKLTFPCIVEGCKNRFSSQLMLNRHVNNHFPENSSSSSSNHGARKSIEGAPARKVLKRAGVKLKLREVIFSARIFDFFDSGIMAGVRHQVCDTQRAARALGIADDMTMTFQAKAMSIRVGEMGHREVHIRWVPENMLPDEWVPLETAPTTKSIKMGMLPESAKNRLQQELHLTRPSQQPFTKHPRKRKAQTAAQQNVPTEMSSSTQAAVIPPSSKQRRLMSSKSSLSPAAIAKLFM